MEIRIANNQSEWDAWLERTAKPTPFTQSYAWGDVLAREGKRVLRYIVTNEKEIVAEAQVVVQPLIFGWRYAFCPKGLVLKKELKPEMVRDVFNCLKQLLQKEKCILFRFEPAEAVPASIGRLEKSIDVNPRATSVLDLTMSEEKLLNAMHQKTRYNVRLAEKKGVTVREGIAWDIFWKLMRETGSRDGFRLHHEEHYRAIFSAPFVRQFTAYFGSEPAAVAVAIGFGDTFTYVFGASDYAHRSAMAPQLLQWEMIRAAKKSGYRSYDFFGIAPTKIINGEFEYDEKHQYAGVTRFKLGFGGAVVEQPGTFDLIISPFAFAVYKLLRALRRRKK